MRVQKWLQDEIGGVGSQHENAGDHHPDPLLLNLVFTRGFHQVKDKEQHCEAYFYLGEQALRQGKTDEAKSFFTQTVETGVVDFIEYTGARVELNRIQ